MTTTKTSRSQTGHAPYCEPKRDDVEYFGAVDIIAAELDSIRERRKQRGLPCDKKLQTKDLCGLALSGGGIRSASFSLGIMQALAYNGWLNQIDYLSTVSGGGYIGSSLTWSLHCDPKHFGLTDEIFPFSSFPMSSEARTSEEHTSIQSRLDAGKGKVKWSGRLLNFLRQNATYLTPGNGLNFFSLVWGALRGASLGFLVYGALLVFLFLAFFQLNLFQKVCAFPQVLDALRHNWLLFLSISGLALLALTVPLYSLATYVYRFPIFQSWSYQLRRFYERWFAGRLLPVLLALCLLGSIPLAHDLMIDLGKDRTAKSGKFKVSGNLTSAGTLSFIGTMNVKTVAKQSTQPNAIPCLSPVSKPSPPDTNSLWKNISEELEALGAGLGTILVGLLSGIMAFLKTRSIKPGRIPLGLIVGLSVAALLFGILLLAYTMAFAVVKTTGCQTATAWFYTGIILVVTLFTATMTNINHISIHRYYRDRLMETFMPDINHVLQGDYLKATESGRANTEPLQTMTDGPFHIINTNVVLVSSDKPKFRVRGGDNFILSPQYCGSYATGWQLTEKFIGGTMTLASAMAISGAALNPSAGCGGEGITRSPVLSVLMGFLNFRLGYWVPNPMNRKNWRGKLRNPNFLLPGLCEVLFRNLLTEKGTFLQLSDGGHFENLGLYELVRRKLKLIIVCDGGADPEFTFGDLANAMEKVRTDFGALIMINNNDLEELIPQKADDDEDPDRVRCARKGYLAATIKYADNSKGTLIYLTTTFFKDVSADLYGYKKEHSAFPDEPTSDQFFDERQFEAYRELGFQAAWKMMKDKEVIRQAWPDGAPKHG